MKPLTAEMKNYIQYGTEERRWEFKPPMTWSKGRKKNKFDVVRAVLALSNTTNGGFIIFGISQKRDRSSETEFKRIGLTKNQYISFKNDDDIGRFINTKSNQELKFNIHGGTVTTYDQINKFVVLQIYESQNSIPVICTSDFKTKDRHCRLNKGTLYIRSTSNPIESRVIRTNEEWEELIRRLLSRKEEILSKDLKALCSNVKPDKKQTSSKQPREPRQSRQYDIILKRDKL